MNLYMKLLYNVVGIIFNYLRATILRTFNTKNMGVEGSNHAPWFSLVKLVTLWKCRDAPIIFYTDTLRRPKFWNINGAPTFVVLSVSQEELAAQFHLMQSWSQSGHRGPVLSCTRMSISDDSFKHHVKP